MKKTVAKLTLGLTSTAILATVGAQTVSADSYVVQDGDSFFGIAAASGMDPYVLAANNGKSIFDGSCCGSNVSNRLHCLQVQSASTAQGDRYLCGRL